MMFVRLCFIIGISLALMACSDQTDSKEAVPEDTTNQVDSDTESMADHLATVAAAVPNVNAASAIIAGPYAVVAIDLDATLKEERIGTVKYTVSEALKEDPYGKTAVVIADADIMTRIDEMRDKMDQGHPVRGIVDELAEIVSRYMPIFPVQEDRPEDLNETDEKIKDDENLKKIQEEQSKEFNTSP